MDRLKVRFEQRRGHYLVMEGEPPFSRGDCDEFQLRMLLSCEVPGLLRLETEEIDGSLSFRYALSGTRMLSQAMRTEKWTMSDFMGALCRVAEVLEDCRLYVLDADKVLLEDDRIFAGEDWRDLRFVYLPLADSRQRPGSALEALIVRWMMHVADLDGIALQRLLRLASSPDFKPALLRGFARQYLAGNGGTPTEESRRKEPFVPSGTVAAEQPVARISASSSSGRPYPIPPPAVKHDAEVPASAGTLSSGTPSPSWRWFEPKREEAHAHSLSGLLGHDSGPFPSEREPIAEEDNLRDSAGRRQVWLVCAAIGIAAAAWRWGYAAHPETAGLSISAGITLAVALGYLWLRFGFARKAAERPWKPVEAEQERKVPRQDASASQRAWDIADEEPHRPTPLPQPPSPRIPQWHGDIGPPESTGGFAREAERTQRLDPEMHSAAPVYYLEWETASGTAPPIPLIAPSFVIGRSREASTHVDETPGVSRAHLELQFAEGRWTAKDLGSRNGTSLNGVQMAAYEAYPLSPDDVLGLAGSRYRFKHGVLHH
ncbi:DUF6382 domain-containing protein [Cohnella candidum]|uniref:FHA domain-containing protein n=1 Tax=Cohnella candidum TaxID=2674991 RepID=A0A3G3JZJ3_9BACL|nr:DUF6382 domain-containing protein [Cohnella candidum]AYQ73676.1 FHA domain-containing protein [Cohnella candidum]